MLHSLAVEFKTEYDRELGRTVRPYTRAADADQARHAAARVLRELLKLCV